MFGNSLIKGPNHSVAPAPESSDSKESDLKSLVSINCLDGSVCRCTYPSLGVDLSLVIRAQRTR